MIYSKTKEDHENHLRFMLDLLRNEKLYVKFSKCEFWLQEEKVKPRRVQAMAMTIQSGVKGLILVAQGEAFMKENEKTEGLNGTDQQMEKREDGSLHYLDRI
nr:putative reverse transcriptase domain-containing protein [Tanacetum cinerariifolium]